MRFVYSVVAALLAVYVSATPYGQIPLNPFYQHVTVEKSCKNPKIRKEWRTLPVEQRKSYIKAVKCMLTSPSKYKHYFWIANSRYDDFVALHANATGGGINLNGFKGREAFKDKTMEDELERFMDNGIHKTGTFLPWHRNALQLWEDALNSECGYEGTQPYWDWYLDTPGAGGSFSNSPVFDVESGHGGDGIIPTTSDQKHSHLLSKPSHNSRRSAHGTSEFNDDDDWDDDWDDDEDEDEHSAPEDCVQDGPFKNLTIRIGPMGQMTLNNERCLKRRFNSRVAHEIAGKRSMSAVLNSKDFTEFRMLVERGQEDHIMEEDFGGTNGSKHDHHIIFDGDLHNIGHTGIGGEMRDTFTSINDPLFFIHHAGLDRVWALWQEMDTSRRLHDAGPPNYEKEPVPLSLDSMIWVGAFGPDRKASEVFDTLNRDGRGHLCYKYEGLPVSTYLL